MDGSAVIQILLLLFIFSHHLFGLAPDHFVHQALDFFLSQEESFREAFPPLSPSSSLSFDKKKEEDFVSPEQLVHKYSQAVSAMYMKEVPLFSILLQTNRKVNEFILRQKNIISPADISLILDRTSSERHNAIRVGNLYEFESMLRIFRVMGMFPHKFYDLTKVGQPFLSTAVRSPTRPHFRTFVSVMNSDDSSFFDPVLSQEIKEQLSQRQVVPSQMLQLLDKIEQQGGIRRGDVDSFIHLALQTIKWTGVGMNLPLYQKLMKKGLQSSADIVCFPTHHTNHTTPNTLDIDLLQQEMKNIFSEINAEKGTHYQMKTEIEGPPRRNIPILLRQTSFLALEEKVFFKEGSITIEAFHRARFGEIEERGASMTPKGENLYNKVLSLVNQEKFRLKRPLTMLEKHSFFSCIPDSYEELILEDLIYTTFSLKLSSPLLNNSSKRFCLLTLIKMNWLQIHPLRYDDFLPQSAAGIFSSNNTPFTPNEEKKQKLHYDKSYLERGSIRIIDPHILYEQQQQLSIRTIFSQLRFEFEPDLSLKQVKRSFPDRQLYVSLLSYSDSLSSC